MAETEWVRRGVRSGLWLAVLAAVVLVPGLASAQLPLGGVINVSANGGDSRQPHMVVDAGGALHVAWADDTGDPGIYRIRYRRSGDHGQSFSATQVLSDAGSASLRPRLATGGGALYLVWMQDVADEAKDIMFRRSLDGGQTWGPIVNVSSSAADSREGRVAVGPNGTVYVAWDEVGGSGGIALARSFDGGATFESPRILFSISMSRNCNPGEPTGACTPYPGIAVDPASGRVYLVWHDGPGTSFAIRFSRSSDGGATWSAVQTLSTGANHSHCAAITVGPSGRVLIAYEFRKQETPHRHDSMLVQSTNGGVSFTAPLNLSSGPDFAFSDYPWPSEAPNGLIVVGWEDNTRGGELDAVVAVSTNGGASFSPNEDVSNNDTSTSTEVVTLFGADGTLHVLWEDYENGQAEVFLRVAVGLGAGGPPPPPPPPPGYRPRFDFDGDGKADLGVYRTSTGQWLIFGSATGFTGPVPFGAPGMDVPVPADYDGDGRTDHAVFRPPSGQWLVFGSASGFMAPGAFGAPGDEPVPMDYDGDGKADFAVYRPTTAEWFIFGSATGFGGAVPLGAPALGDVPVPGDYDGDGRADLAVYRMTTAQWFIFGSATGFNGAVLLGAPGLGDVPVPGDYDGDGKVDLAVYRMTTAEWFVFGSATGFNGAVLLGAPGLGDVPVPADYDGDGRMDLAVFRTTTGEWFIFGSSTGFTGPVALGAPALGDTPLEKP